MYNYCFFCHFECYFFLLKKWFSLAFISLICTKVCTEKIANLWLYYRSWKTPYTDILTGCLHTNDWNITSILCGFMCSLLYLFSSSSTGVQYKLNCLIWKPVKRGYMKSFVLCCYLKLCKSSCLSSLKASGQNTSKSVLKPRSMMCWNWAFK